MDFAPEHKYEYHPETYMGSQYQNQGFGDFWSDLRDQFNLPDTDEALEIFKNEGADGLKKAVARGVVSSDKANQLLQETAKEQGVNALASNIRENWKMYLVIGGGVALLGAGVMFVLGRGSR